VQALSYRTVLGGAHLNDHERAALASTVERLVFATT
jgi:hypothetical protein